MPTSTPYTARIRRPEILERGKAQQTELKVFLDGVQVVPSSGTYTLTQPNGTDRVVSEQVVTIDTDGTVTFNHSSSELATTLPLGEGYLQEFKLVISGDEHTFRRLSAVTLRRLYPTVTDIDLTDEYHDLDELRPSSLTSYQSYITSAWMEILRRTRTNGTCYSYLVLSPESFHDSLLHLTLYKIFRDFHTGLSQSNGRFFDIANEEYRLYNHHYSQISFVYDTDHENRAQDPDKRTGQPVIFLSSPPAHGYTRRS